MTVPAELTEALDRLGLGPVLGGAPLTGGVSSDVWRVDLADGPVCVKRALPRLRVAADWQAPTVRAAWEARWLRLAAEVLPGAACGLRAFDEKGRVLVLDWLDPAGHPVWKDRLLAGSVDAAAAAELGRRLAVLHAGAVGAPGWDEARPLFATLRIEPYLGVTARRHPALAPELDELAEMLAGAATTILHGDVSPKNILLGPDGPVLLDAECASPGDPAFDVAFCANHLLLKAVLLPARRIELAGAAGALVTSYLAGVTWERAGELDRRLARLLPALALGRVDGMSPAEYLTEDHRRLVRRAAADLLLRSPAGFAELADRWLSYIEEST